MIISYYLIAAEGGGESNPPPITCVAHKREYYFFISCHLASLLASLKLEHFPFRTLSIRATPIRTVSN